MNTDEKLRRGTTELTGGVREYVAVIVAAMLGEYSLLIMPFIVTAMMQGFGTTEAVSGNLVSAQLVAMGLAGIGVSYALRVVPARVIVVVSAIAIVVANGVCAIGAGTTALVIGRCLTGLGEGSLMAAAGAIAAGVPNAHRLYSILGFVIAGVAAAALVATPLLLQVVGARGVFWLLTCSPIAVLATFEGLPASMATGSAAPVRSALRIPGALPVLISFGLLWVGASALWVFAELIGTASGLTLPQVGTYLAIGQVAGLLGPILAARYGKWVGLRVSIVIGNVVMALGGLAMVYGHGPIGYAGGAAAMSIAIMFLTPCYRTLMATFDVAGRVVALSVAFYTFGFGLAPALVGIIHDPTSGYGSVAVLATLAFAVAAGLAFVLSGRQQLSAI